MTADAPSTPTAEVDITVEMIGALLSAQHPDLACLPVRIVEAGWDNVMVRLGDDLALRLPRRAVAEPLIENEQRWLPWLAPQLPIAIPAPLRCGVPGKGYPFHWSVLPWLPGEAADLSPPNAGEALCLAEFLKTLHKLPLPSDAPRNAVRDCGLQGKQRDTEKRLETLARETDLITPTVMKAWRKGLETEIDLPRCFIAGDVHARNVLVDSGKISAIIDWGDMCAGDPATDLASIWGLFDDVHARQTAIGAYAMSDATLTRAKAWAVFYGAVLTDTGRKDTPRHAAMGEAIFRRIEADA